MKLVRLTLDTDEIRTLIEAVQIAQSKTNAVIQLSATAPGMIDAHGLRKQRALAAQFKTLLKTLDGALMPDQTKLLIARDALQWFVDRVESGQVKSVETYTHFKNVLEMLS